MMPSSHLRGGTRHADPPHLPGHLLPPGRRRGARGPVPSDGPGRVRVRHRGRARPTPRLRGRAGGRRGLLVRGEPGLHGGPHAREPEQRRREPRARLGAGRDEAASRLLEPRPSVHDVVRARAAAGGRSRADGAPVGGRQGGGGLHAQRVREPADHAARPRLPARRRGPDVHAGLSAHDHDLQAARASGRHRPAPDPAAHPRGGSRRGGAPLRVGHHPQDEGDPRVAHDQHHGPDPPGPGSFRDGAPPRHPAHRRRRPRPGALRLHARRARRRQLLDQPAQVAVRAARHRACSTCAGRRSPTCGP